MAENDPFRSSPGATRKWLQPASKKTLFRAEFLASPPISEKHPSARRVYTRVSRSTISRRCRLQRRTMLDYVERRGWTIAVEIKEIGSGASVRELRQLVQAVT